MESQQLCTNNEDDCSAEMSAVVLEEEDVSMPVWFTEKENGIYLDPSGGGPSDGWSLVDCCDEDCQANSSCLAYYPRESNQPMISKRLLEDILKLVEKIKDEQNKVHALVMMVSHPLA